MGDHRFFAFPSSELQLHKQEFVLKVFDLQPKLKKQLKPW